jgi:hypothetical protein
MRLRGRLKALGTGTKEFKVSLKVAIDNLKLDSRMVDINYKSQSLTVEEYNKYLEKLPDVKAMSMSLDLDGEDHSSDSEEN